MTDNPVDVAEAEASSRFIWQWVVGPADGPYDMVCGSREEAAETASLYGGKIAEMLVRNAKLSECIFVRDFLNVAENIMSEDGCAWNNQDGIFDVEDQALADLQSLLRYTADHWQRKHGLVFTTTQHVRVRNVETIAPENLSD
ncbi:hypothetical protein C8N35_1162 [Breoghania corrubedonensis]|uniref:Uncharacterized protein n=1 Tax=Breoghania corrubedonensis TaxID=665038 RepID=A0A2T5UPV2_9HYPH|nr:hypothetical protein [Breoghania corrubedonensis]PTW53547.1 hypothetical protein C8N35_1162 [Breoghania corrubedonensis]